MKFQNRLRPWLRFRLRTLLIMVAILAIPFGWRAHQIRSEKAAIAWVEELGGEVNYEYRPNETILEKATAAWLGRKKAERIYLSYQKVTDVSPLAKLKEAKLICLQSTQVGDLTPLVNLKQLETLDLTNTQVSPEQVQVLRQELPNCRINYTPSEQLTLWGKLVEDWRISVNRKQ